MTSDINKPLQLKKKDAISDTCAISHGVKSFSRVYAHDDAEGRLYTQEFVEVCLITSGVGIHRVFDQITPCKAGDVFIIPSDVPHGYFASDECESLTVRRLWFDVGDWFFGEVSDKASSRFCYGIFKDNAITACAMLNTYTYAEVNAIYNSIEYEISKKESEWRDSVCAYLSRLLIIISRYINCQIKNIRPAGSKAWNAVLATMRFVEKHFGDCDLTLESIANLTYISKSQLSRNFKELVGETFSDYLRDVRLKNACALLETSNMTVEEIVDRCGLRDVSSFYRNFSERMNMTPHAYRHSFNTCSTDKITNKDNIIMSILNQISENLQIGKAKIVKQLVSEAISNGSNPEEILNEGLLAGMNIIGEKFKNNEVYVPEVLLAARAMNMGAQELKPYLEESGVVAGGRVCIGTVQGDLHDIGKNLVKMMMECKGLEVIDAGVDVSPEAFVKTAIEDECRVICCSALLTTTMGVMADVVKAAEAAGIRDKVKIMIGGAPVTEEFCKKIGADCYTSDAASAADAAVELCKAD